MCRFFLLFTVYFFISCVSVDHKTVSPVKNDKSFTTFTRGLNLFHNKKYVAARRQFEKINLEDKYFIDSLLEIQKINYRLKNWDRFFGVAIYYRSNILVSNKMFSKNYIQELLVLEILALMYHCRFKESKQLIDWGINLAKQSKKPFFKLKKTMYFLNVKRFIVGDKIKDNKEEFKNKIYFWHLTAEQLHLLDNPKYIYLKVKSLC